MSLLPCFCKTYLDSKLDGVILADHLVADIVLLQELTDSLGVPADGVGLPLGVGAARVGLVQAGCAVIVKTLMLKNNYVIDV